MSDLLDHIRHAQRDAETAHGGKILTLIQVGSISHFEKAVLRAVGTLKKEAVETATTLVGIPVQQHPHLPDNSVALWAGKELLTVFSFEENDNA